MHQVYHDVLTGLPNRKLLYDRLDMALKNARRIKNPVGVLFLDLDGFKSLNDAMGHEMGDYYLKALAKRLIRCIRECDTIARIGGDEFVFIVTMDSAKNVAAEIAARIIDATRETFIIGEKMVTITASVGISVFPDHGGDPDELISKADSAMYEAKQNGKNRCHTYRP